MRRTILIGAMVSAAIATGAGAQATQTPGTKANERTSGSEVRMTGCLRSADGSGDARSGGTTPAATPRSHYSLTDAMTLSDTKATGAGNASAGATGAPPAAASYQLVGGNPGDLGKYVNSKVEILGDLSTPSTSSPAPPSTGATSGSTGTAGATGSGATSTRETGTTPTLPTLRVRSVRQVATSCMP